MKKISGILWLLLSMVAPLRAAEPTVLVTVKPLAWVVQALLPAGVDVSVLVPAGISPHDYQLRPADVLRVKRSDLLVWVGPGMEPWLMQLAQQVPPEKQIELLPRSLDDHEHHEQTATHTAIENDPHIWLDPLALRAQAAPLATRLVTLFPTQEKNIRAQQAQFEQAMTALDAELAATLSPVAAQGFVVYHDGYQRLVQRYHLNQRAAVWHHESLPVGAQERANLLQLLNSGSVRCLFYEPEHGRDAVQQWLGRAAQSVHMVELDPLGEKIPTGTDAYALFMRDLVGKIASCLAD